MGQSNSTCWMLIKGAAAGRREDREEFARRYEPAVRAYFGARWKSTQHAGYVDDAVQEVFVECFRERGVLERADPGRAGGFRPFLYGVARNVALRFESREDHRKEKQPPSGLDLDSVERQEETLSKVFDRAWARCLLREAFARLEERVQVEGEPAAGRVELLRLRFEKGLTIREIAGKRGVDEKALYREYDRAKRCYRSALMEVVTFHHPGTPGEVERECEQLLALVGSP